jgi:predicted dehydrogenase
MPGLSPLRFAVVGVGVWGERHAATLRAIERDTAMVQLVAIADPDAARLEDQSRALGVKGYHGFRDLVTGERVDAVCICAPDQHHVEPALAALAAGLHVLIEKPLATTVDDAHRIADAARRAGTTVTVGHILRYMPQYRSAHAAVADGRVGDLIHLIARRFGLIRAGERIAGRASLAMFQAIHDLDVLRWLGGPVTRVHAEASSKLLARFGTADSLCATLRFANGAVGVVESSWALPLETAGTLSQELDVLGTTGRVEIRQSGEGLAVTGSGRSDTPFLSLLGLTPSALREELMAFAAAVRGGPAPAMSVDEGVEAVRLAQAVDESIRTGHSIPLDGSAS